jgi:hypothetical protein
MTMAFQQLDEVRVVRLVVAAREVDGFTADPPQPRVGESGTVVEPLGDDLYLVERATDDGRTLWLAEFHASELELVDRPPRDGSADVGTA